MSNKPKNQKRIEEYSPTKGERCHKNLVDYAKKNRRLVGAYSSKHVGSKPFKTLEANARRPQFTFCLN